MVMPVMAATIYNDNIIPNAVRLETTVGTQLIQMQDDGSVLSNEAVIGMTGNDHLKAVVSQYSKSISALRNQGEKFVYLDNRNVNADNIINLCMQFIKNKYDKLAINTENLRVRHYELSGNCWDVTFAQTYEGIDVRGGFVRMMIFKSGRIQTFNSTIFNDIALDKSKPTISFQTVENAATVGLPSTNYDVTVRENFIIIPCVAGRNYNYRLAYECDVVKGISEHYVALVDANTGELIARDNLVWNFDLNVKSKNYAAHPNEPMAIFHVPFLEVTIRGNTYRSSQWESVPTPIDFSPIGEQFTTTYTGTYAKMFSVAGSGEPMGTPVPYSYTGTITANGIEMLDSNNYDEIFRTVYNNVNRSRAYFQSIDPGWSGLNIQMQCYVQILPDNLIESLGTHFNAYARQDNILGFYASNSNRVFMAKSDKVTFHEHGHSAVYSKYFARTERGMINSTANESRADIHSAFLTKNPRVFENVVATADEAWGLARFWRNCDNEWRFPDSVVGRRHDDSQILSGALWRFRNLLSDDNKRDAEISAHRAKNYVPDGYTLDAVFSSWFDAVVRANDALDDEDEGQGTFTRNFDEVYAAFEKHGIGFDLLIQNRFNHSNIADQPSATQPISITATISDIPTPREIEEVWVNYYTHINSEPMQVLLTKSPSADGTAYSGEIPAQLDGVRVYYYFTYRNPFSNAVVRINRDYLCFVGYTSKYRYDCEIEGGWQVRNREQTRLGWVIGNPPLISSNAASRQDAGRKPGVELYSPGFAAEGNRAWRTQVTNTFNAQTQNEVWQTLLDTTILESHNIDLSGSQNVFLSFYLYLYNGFGGNFNGLSVEVSFDGGATWKVAPTDFKGRQQPKNWNWERHYINVTKLKGEDEVFGEFFKVRFVCNANNQTIGLSVLIDDIEILNTDNPITVEDYFVTTEVQVSPNPAGDEVTLTFPRALYLPEVQILNTLGSEVMTINFNGEFNSVPVNIRGLANGVYFLRVKSEGKTYQSKLNVIR